MILATFKYALRDSLRLKRTGSWLAMAFLGLILASIWGRLMPGTKPADHYVTVVGLLVFRIAALAAAIFMTAIVSKEVEERTIVYLLTRPVPRWQLLVGRFFANLLVVLIICFVATVMVSLGSYKSLSNPMMSNDLLAIALGVFAYSGLFLFLTLLVNRALILCVLFAFGWESSIPNLPTGMHRVSVLTHMQAVAQHPDIPGSRILDFAVGSANEGSVSPTAAAVTLLLIGLVGLGVSIYWFNNNEYLAREDAE